MLKLYTCVRYLSDPGHTGEGDACLSNCPKKAATRSGVMFVLLSASVPAIGLTRGGDGSLRLLAPGQKEMQCEAGCRFRPFCLPGPCSEEEDCATEPVVCTDETWETCATMRVACPAELRAEMCATATDLVCQQRMGVEVYDRQAQAAEREAYDEANIDPAEAEANKPPPPKKCMSMATPKEDEWCTITCNFDEPSCAAAKLCRCGSDKDIEGWRYEKEHENDSITDAAGKSVSPWDVQGACDLEAHGCRKHAASNEPCVESMGYKGLSCIEHFKHCMETPRMNPETNRVLRMSTQDCLDDIAGDVRQCNSCNNTESKDAFTLFVGPNYEAFTSNAEGEEAADRIEEEAKAATDAFEASAEEMAQAEKIKSDARAAEAKDIADSAAAAAIAAATSPPPFPPEQPPSPPDAPFPPSHPKLQAKDLLATNRRAAYVIYKDAQKTREAAEDAANAAREQALNLPPGDIEQSTAANELTAQADEALGEARIAEDEAEAAFNAAKDAEDRYAAAAAPREAAEATAQAAKATADAAGAGAVTATSDALTVGEEATAAAAAGAAGVAKEAAAAAAAATAAAAAAATAATAPATTDENAKAIEDSRRAGQEAKEEQRRVAEEHEQARVDAEAATAEATAAFEAAAAAASETPAV